MSNLILFLLCARRTGHQELAHGNEGEEAMHSELRFPHANFVRQTLHLLRQGSARRLGKCKVHWVARDEHGVENELLHEGLAAVQKRNDADAEELGAEHPVLDVTGLVVQRRGPVRESTASKVHAGICEQRGTETTEVEGKDHRQEEGSCGAKKRCAAESNRVCASARRAQVPQLAVWRIYRSYPGTTE